MLLRNYDNFIVANNSCFGEGGTKKIPLEAIFGEGHYSFKDIEGNVITSTNGWYSAYPPFSLFNKLGGGSLPNSNGYSNLICGYESAEVTYDDYKIDNLTTNLVFVSHTHTIPQINENNEFETTYSKVLCNTSGQDITINRIGVAMYNFVGNYRKYLLFKEAIPEITIAPNQNVVLTFTTKIPLGQNKPADYGTTASVE